MDLLRPPKRVKLEEDLDSEDHKLESKFWSKILGKSLYQYHENGSCVDLEMILGPRRTSVKVHKLVICAMSQVFETQLTKPCWNEGIDDKQFPVIELPEDISEEANRKFIKYLYLEELEEQNKLSRQTIWELMVLADMYLVKGLFTLCDEIFCSLIRMEDCIFIYQTTKRFSNSEANKKAFDFMKKNIVMILNNQKGKDYDYCSWESETWETLLKQDYLRVDEIDLFTAFVKWRDTDRDSREDKFQELLNLVRFPTMTTGQVANVVAKSDALNKEDLIDLFVYLNKDNDDGNRKTKFNSSPRRLKFVSTSDQLDYILKYDSEAGDIIQISEGEFEGEFNVRTPNVTIRGSGRKTVLIESSERPHLMCIYGGRSKIENLTVSISESSRAILMYGVEHVLDHIWMDYFGEQNVHMDCRGCGLEIFGTGHEISNVSAQNLRIGIIVNGEDIKVTNCEMKNTLIGIQIMQDDNFLDNITLLNVKEGIDLRGHESMISNVKYNWTLDEGEEMRAVKMTGRGHVINDVTVEGLENYGCSIYMTNFTKHAMVNRCAVGSVVVRGNNNTLTSINAGHTLRIHGANHEFLDCSTHNLVIDPLLKDTKFKRCDFANQPLPIV